MMKKTIAVIAIAVFILGIFFVIKGRNQVNNEMPIKKIERNQDNIYFEKVKENERSFKDFFVILGVIIIIGTLGPIGTFFFYKKNALSFSSDLIKEKEEELKVMKEKRENYDKNNLYGEDSIYNLKRKLRLIRKKSWKIQKEIIQEGKNEKTEKEIKELAEEEKNILEQIKKQSADFKNNRPSGIAIATLESQIEKMKKIKNAETKTKIAWILLFSLIFLLIFFFILLFFLIFNIKGAIWLKIFISLLATVGIKIFFLTKNYLEVPHKEEWVIEFFGYYFTNWEPGPHILFPFFMKIKEKAYTGTFSRPLYLDEKERDGKKRGKIEFSDDSAEMAVELYFRIFDVDRAVYEIDDLIGSICEKMEAGIRAYYGQKKLDEAIETRTNVDLRQILIQPACDAEVFKEWGVEIIGIAVTDITLSQKTEELRQKNLVAQKELETSVIAEETAEVDARISAKKGTGYGNKISQLAEKAKISNEEAAYFLLTQKKWEAAKNASSLFLGDDNKNVAAGIGMGIGLQEKKEKNVKGDEEE